MTKISECIAPSFFDLHKMLKNDEITELWLKGGRGSTKSSFSSIEVFLGLINDPDANVVVFRRFENEIHDSVYSQLEWAAYTLGIHHLFRFYKSPHKIVYLETGQLILFKGADNPKKIKSIKLATGYVKYAWFEEVDQFGGMKELRNILQSIFRGTTKKQVALFSFNPPKSARSWVNAEVKIQKKGRMVHHSDYRMVPKEWLGETFIANAEHLKEVNPDAYEHEYLGKETGTGLEVFNNVTIRPITDKEISYFDYRYQGVDFGYAADPLCFGEMHFDNKKKTLYIYFEVSGIKMSYTNFTEQLTPEQLAEVTMADKASPRDIAQLKDDFNMNIIGAEKPPGSVDSGIKWLQDLEQIIIDPVRCPLASTEFINYALDVNRMGETISKYPDKDNHAIDMVRYAMALQIAQTKAEKRKNKFKVRTIPVLSRW